ncbi:MAG: diguanylate cyclase [Sulfurovum sp.]
MQKLNKIIEFTKRLRLLFVEDDRSARVSTIILLEEFFNNIFIAKDGEEGLELFKTNCTDIDIIITDINMPRLNGLDMIEQIREIDSNVPIVIFSANYESEYFIRSIYANVQGYVVKPIDINQFLNVLDKVIIKIELLEVESKLKEQHQYLESIINRVDDPIMVIRDDYTIALMNDISKKNLRHDKIADINNPKCYEVSHNITTPCDGLSHPCPLQIVISTNTKVTVVHQHFNKDGERHFLELIATPLLDDDKNCIGIIESARDITNYLDTQKRLEKQANHDSLTGLPNRNLFHEKLESEINLAKDKNSQVALFFIDFDKFKIINDTRGHKAGDTVLIEAGSRMRDSLSQKDTLARLGGDEFTAIITDFNDINDLIIKAKTILDRLRLPIIYDTHSLSISGSIGISIYPNDTTDISMLLKYADKAMYRAKEMGRDNFQLHSSSLNEGKSPDEV